MSETRWNQSIHERIDTSEIQHRRVVIENSHGEKLVGVLQDTGSTETVVICHGIHSSKDRIPMVTIANVFERAKISSFRFDFAGNGESEGSFQYGNYRREVEDLRSVLQHLRGENRVISAIVGHSKGGSVVLLYVAKYKDVQAVVNISGRFFLERGMEWRLGKDYFKRIRENGFIDVRNRKGKFEYRVTEESLMDRLTTNTHEACLSIHENCRVLTVHGTNDSIVHVTDASEFAKHIKNHKLCLIEGADHEFTSHQHQLASTVLAFFKLDPKDSGDVSTSNRNHMTSVVAIKSRI
ncbi:Alpha/beta-Hydrolases superfamily protein [Hirschfeldia incana]|nr:Alpha/beta-Hydrolases superfamily protein [Hirschfeldia incana]